MICRKWKTYLAVVLLKIPHWNPIEWSPRAPNPYNGKPCHIKGWQLWPAYQICPLHILITHELGMVLHCSMVKKIVTVEYMKFNFQCPCAYMAQSPTLCNPMDCNPLDSSVHEIFLARILEWPAMPSSRGSSWPRDQTHVSHVSYIAGKFFYHLSHQGSSSMSINNINWNVDIYIYLYLAYGCFGTT